MKGSAPELILSARLLALSAVKLPEITASPFVIASFTVGAEIISLSIQMEMDSPVPAIVCVTVAKVSFAVSESFSDTTYEYVPSFSGCLIGSAFKTSLPSRTTSPAGEPSSFVSVPTLNESTAVSPSSLTAALGSKSFSPACHGNLTITLSFALS